MEDAVLEQNPVEHLELYIGSTDVSYREIASSFEAGVPNADLTRMSVKAFGWEANRKKFQFKKKVLKRIVKDAFGEDMPMYRTFVGKVVDRNHLMKDSGARTNEPIGYIEAAYLKTDGVYFDLCIWKRCVTEEEQRQIRENEVSVSMEVDFTKPILVIDGETVPNTSANRKDANAVRTMADDAIVNGLGIAVLFDGITPAFASAGVTATENAAMTNAPEPTEDTVPDNKERGSEDASAQPTTSKEITEMPELEDLKAELEARNLEVASANEALAAKSMEIDKLYEEMAQLREQRFNEIVGAAFDLGKLEPSTASWLLDMLRWSGDIEGTCAKLNEIAAAGKAVPTTEVAAVEGAVTEVATEAPGAATTETPAEVASVEEPPVVEVPAVEAVTEIVPEIAAVNIAAAPAATTVFPASAPRWGVEHL